MKYAALVLVLALGSAEAQTKCHGFKMNFCFDGEVIHHVPCPPCPKPPVKKKAKQIPSFDCGNGWSVSEPSMCPGIVNAGPIMTAPCASSGMLCIPAPDPCDGVSCWPPKGWPPEGTGLVCDGVCMIDHPIQAPAKPIPVEPHGKCWTGTIDEANEVPCPVEPHEEGWITLKSVPMLPGETGLCMDGKCYPLPQENPKEITPGCVDGKGCITFTQTPFPVPSLTVGESSDDKGYQFTVNSADKSFKCYVISTMDERPNNVYDKGLAAFTVACVKVIERGK